MKKLPVLINFFNRPDKLILVLNKLKEIPDIEIYYASDGPKSKEDELRILECLEHIQIIFGKINKNRILLRDSNIGCKLAIPGNLNWFFDNVPYGLVLEDDTVPNDYFFINGRIALEQLKNNTKYISINGTDLQTNLARFKTFRESYLPLFWGWGSWAHMWRLYELEIKDSQHIVKLVSGNIYGARFSMEKFLFEEIFKARFNDVQGGFIDTWDYSFVASAWKHGKLSLQMNNNSVINIGFDSLATHTVGKKPNWVPVKYSDFQYKPGIENIDLESDKWIIKNSFNSSMLEFSKCSVKDLLRRIKF